MHRGEVDGFIGGNDFKSKMGNFRKNPNKCFGWALSHEVEGGHIFIGKKPLNFYICYFMDILSEENKAQKNFIIFWLTELTDIGYDSAKQSMSKICICILDWNKFKTDVRGCKLRWTFPFQTEDSHKRYS